MTRHPYRDAAIMHCALGAVVVVVSWALGRGAARGLLIGAAYVGLAVAWSWWRFRQRARRQAAREGES